MKAFDLIIHVDEKGIPRFKFEPNEPHTVAETQQLLSIISQLVGSTPVGGHPILREETKNGDDTAGKTEA